MILCDGSTQLGVDCVRYIVGKDYGLWEPLIVVVGEGGCL